MSNIPITIQDMESMSFTGTVDVNMPNVVSSSDYAPAYISSEPPMTLNTNRIWAMEVLQHIYNNNGKCLQGNGVECTCPCEAFYKMNECKRGLFIKSSDRRN